MVEYLVIGFVFACLISALASDRYQLSVPQFIALTVLWPLPILGIIWDAYKNITRR